LNSENQLKTTYTEGYRACAAAKAALTMLLTGKIIETISIYLPTDKKIDFQVSNGSISNGTAKCSIVQDSGNSIIDKFN
jgi:cobalt-precorrin-5B (C1)-methyltransferase